MQTFNTEGILEAGVDESGRGPGLGRVYTAAVVWPPGLTSPLVRDSKTISKHHMKASYEFVIENALAYSIDYGTEEEIEKGILSANMTSMHRSLTGLYRHPYLKDAGKNLQHILVDGNYFEPYMDPNGNYIDYTTVIKGDSAYYSIAAASILAKWTRDQYIDQLCNEYPDLDRRYGIRDNKGYLSAQKHKDGLTTYGYCQFHRRTWKTFIDMQYNPVTKPVKIKVNIIRKVPASGEDKSHGEISRSD
jgi:ribonuclease HII